MHSEVLHDNRWVLVSISQMHLWSVQVFTFIYFLLVYTYKLSSKWIWAKRIIYADCNIIYIVFISWVSRIKLLILVKLWPRLRVIYQSLFHRSGMNWFSLILLWYRYIHVIFIFKHMQVTSRQSKHTPQFFIYNILLRAKSKLHHCTLYENL